MSSIKVNPPDAFQLWKILGITPVGLAVVAEINLMGLGRIILSNAALAGVAFAPYSMTIK